MRSRFPGYYKPSEDEFQTIWRECLFVTDANVLLNLYGYSEGTREQLLGLFDELADRLRIPHQFAREYQRNRARAIMEQVRNYARVERELKKIQLEEFTPKTKHPFLSDAMLNSFNSLLDQLAESRRSHEDLFTRDPYFERLSSLFDGKVGKAPTAAELDGLHSEAKLRYAGEVPPGYADLKEKGEPAAFGDFIGWSETLDIGKSENRSIILITDDAKEDWWSVQGDRTIGPRPELVEEFLVKCGNAFYMYSSDKFMQYAAQYLQQPVPVEAIREIQGRLQSKTRESADVKPSSEQLPGLAAAKDAPPIEVSEQEGIERGFGRPPEGQGDKPDDKTAGP